MTKESCNCFTCRHGDEPRVVAGYLQGYIDASDWFINWAKKNKIKLGSIADDDLGGIYAQMKCNRDESGCLLEEFPDLEKPIENLEAENQRLKEQNNKMKSVLEDYADKDNWEYYNLDSSGECLIGEYQNCEPNEVGFELAQQVLKQIEEME